MQNFASTRVFPYAGLKENGAGTEITNHGHSLDRRQRPRAGVDIGGTFIDAVLAGPESVHLGQSAVDSADLAAGVLEGLRLLLQQAAVAGMKLRTYRDPAHSSTKRC